MTTELELMPQQPLSAVDVRAQVNLIQEVMQSVMKDGTHFGLIPGAGKKPTLFKAGAEKLASTFRLAADPEVEELSYGDEYRVRIKARILEMGSGRFVGAGVGECSSNESKYMWRAAVCDEEFDQTPELQRRLKWNRGNTGAWSQKQVRMNVADVANTVLKMAKKRALVDGILTVTGASDIFTQDIEELPKEYLDQRVTPASVMPNPTQPSTSGEMHTSATSATPNARGSETASSMPSEPDIRPKSQKVSGERVNALKENYPYYGQEAAPAPAQPQQQAVQGEVVGAEPSISPAQGKRFFAIMRSVGLDDGEVKKRLASVGWHGHRDGIPKRLYEQAIDAIDNEFKFHTPK